MGLTKAEWELVRTTADDFKAARWGYKDPDGTYHL